MTNTWHDPDKSAIKAHPTQYGHLLISGDHKNTFLMFSKRSIPTLKHAPDVKAIENMMIGNIEELKASGPSPISVDSQFDDEDDDIRSQWHLLSFEIETDKILTIFDITSYATAYSTNDADMARYHMEDILTSFHITPDELSMVESAKLIKSMDFNEPIERNTFHSSRSGVDATLITITPEYWW